MEKWIPKRPVDCWFFAGDHGGFFQPTMDWWHQGMSIKSLRKLM